MRPALLTIALALTTTTLPVIASPAQPAPAAATDAARALAQDAIIVDTHIDAPGMLMQHWMDLGNAADGREFDYPKARAGGLDVAFMSIYTSAGQDANGTAWQTANEMIDAVEALAERHPDKFALLRSPADVQSLRKGGRVLLPLGMENGAPIGDDIANVQRFFDRGVRYITLAHSAANRIADSSYAAERQWHGLSPFGRKVVAEMNRLGIMVDVSHISDESARETIAVSTVPVIASHSAFRHFTPGFERNISDELAKAVADKGGVVQIPFGSAFVNPVMAADTQAHFRAINDFNQRNKQLVADGKPEASREAFDKAWTEAHPARETEMTAVLEQIDYAVKLIGIDHVGIGSDFDGVDGELPNGLRTVADFPNLVAALQSRGYSDADIRKLLGENLLRAWTAIEAGAQR